MSENRVDIYTLIHKAQRVHLFGLSFQVALADMSDETQVAAIEETLVEIIKHLKEHAEHEECFIHPLFAEIGTQAVKFNSEHNEIDKQLQKLEVIIAEKKWHELYAEFNKFLAFYLKHQNDEEEAQREVLWKHFDDQRLNDVMNNFKTSRTLEQTLKDFEFILPTLSVPEITAIFSNFKKTAPPELFDSVYDMAEILLDQGHLQAFKCITA
jgi:hypothetical protein